MSAGQPYINRAFQLLALVAVTLGCGACGSSAVSDISAPSAVRCEAAISADPANVPADASSATVTISAARDCTWKAQSEVSWLQLASTSGQSGSTISGQGASTIAVTVASNSQAAARDGAIIVNEQRLTFNQEGRGCTITLSGPTSPMPVSGGRGALQISTLAGCPWSVSSSSTWLTPLTTSGSGAANVAYDVTANTSSAREASLTVAGRTFVVSQDAAPTAPPCSFSINPASRDLAAAGGATSVDVTSPAGCAWTVQGGASWITVDVTSGSGNGKVDYSVTPNPTISARQATLTIAGRVHTVNQAGLVCTISVSPGSQTFPAAASNGQLTITTLPLCPWNASSNAGWVVLGSPSGSGPGTLAYQVLQNTSAQPRMATITVNGQTHAITQSGATPACAYDIAPPSRTVAAGGATATVTLTTTGGCAWTAVSSETWLAVAQSSLSGSGPAEISYTAAANTATTSRTATITVGGRVHTVTQDAAAAPCSYTLTPAQRQMASTGGSATVALTAGPTCAWTAVSSAPTWLTLAPGSASGTGPATITYTATANTTASSRTATITVAGQVHTVTQDAPAVACTYSLSPESREFEPAGGAGTVTVTTGPTCPWTAVSSAGYVMVTNTSGTGTATINYIVSAAGMGVDRTATITVNGQVHSIRQRRTN